MKFTKFLNLLRYIAYGCIFREDRLEI
jgi:hypothetical protein